jgi:hypothetical protein
MWNQFLVLTSEIRGTKERGQVWWRWDMNVGENRCKEIILRWILSYCICPHFVFASGFWANWCEHVGCIQNTFRAFMKTLMNSSVHEMHFVQLLTYIDDLVTMKFGELAWRSNRCLWAKWAKATFLDPLHQFFIILLRFLAFLTPSRRLCLIPFLFLLCENTHHRPLRSERGREKCVSASVEYFIVWGGWGLAVAEINSEVCRMQGCVWEGLQPAGESPVRLQAVTKAMLSCLELQRRVDTVRHFREFLCRVLEDYIENCFIRQPSWVIRHD